MASYRLTDSPSGGQSEVLETLHWEGAHDNAPGVVLAHLGTRVSRRWHGDENRGGSDPQWEADTLTVVGQLQTLGYVTGFSDSPPGAVVDLTAAPPAATRVRLTALGREVGRAPRPHPRTAPY